MFLQLSSIAGSQEVYLCIFLSKSSIEVVDLLHHGLFNQLSKLSDIGDPAFSLSDEVIPRLASIAFVLAVSLPQLVSQASD